MTKIPTVVQNNYMHRMHRTVCTAIAWMSLGSARGSAQAPRGPSLPAPAPMSADSLLNHLIGSWRMVGEVRGKPVSYTLVAGRVLHAHYVELHMTDVSDPPQYEARVFVGADTTAGKVLVHWLDSFGAAFSVPAGNGSVVGDTLRFDIPYSTGPFRDTFIYDRASGAWRFRLQSGDGTGTWRPFAEYDVRRIGSAGSTPTAR